MTTTALEPIVTLNDVHEYHVDGERVPGVGEILSCVGIRRKIWDGYSRWSSLSGEEFMTPYENSRVFGRALHEYARLRMLGQEVEYDQEMRPWVVGWEKFRSEHTGMETILYHDRPLIEIPLYCQSLGYCGTPDAAVVYKNEKIVLDWKTGALNDVYRVKLAAYVMMLRQNTKFHYWHVWLVEILENGYRITKIKPGHIEPSVNEWVSIVNVYRMGRINVY